MGLVVACPRAADAASPRITTARPACTMWRLSAVGRQPTINRFGDSRGKGGVFRRVWGVVPVPGPGSDRVRQGWAGRAKTCLVGRYGRIAMNANGGRVGWSIGGSMLSPPFGMAVLPYRRKKRIFTEFRDGFLRTSNSSERQPLGTATTNADNADLSTGGRCTSVGRLGLKNACSRASASSAPLASAVSAFVVAVARLAPPPYLGSLGMTRSAAAR